MNLFGMSTKHRVMLIVNVGDDIVRMGVYAIGSETQEIVTETMAVRVSGVAESIQNVTRDCVAQVARKYREIGQSKYGAIREAYVVLSNGFINSNIHPFASQYSNEPISRALIINWLNSVISAIGGAHGIEYAITGIRVNGYSIRPNARGNVHTLEADIKVGEAIGDAPSRIEYEINFQLPHLQIRWYSQDTIIALMQTYLRDKSISDISTFDIAEVIHSDEWNDIFYDILRRVMPNEQTSQSKSQQSEQVPRADSSVSQGYSVAQGASRERSIRDIMPTRHRQVQQIFEPQRKSTKIWLVVAFFTILAIAGVLVMLGMRPTVVTVVPVSRTVVFDTKSTYVANPDTSSPSSALAYHVFDSSIEEILPTNSTSTVSDAFATGSITIVNNYTEGTLKLLKSTRFETRDGLVFRVPNEVIVPGKGKITVTVVADKIGSKYNIPAVDRFTLPGLKINAAAFAQVYAYSTSTMRGGSSASSGVDPKLIEDAKQRILRKAQAISVPDMSSSTIPLLQEISFDEVTTTKSGSSTAMLIRAHVKTSSVAKDSLIKAIAGSNGMSTSTTYSLKTSTEFAIVPMASSTMGVSPIVFTLTGGGTLVANVDKDILLQALAELPMSAFQSKIETFASIQTANATMEPIWSKTFPTADKIRIIVRDK